MNLADEKCVSFQAGDQPLPYQDVSVLAAQVPQWALSAKQIEREFKFKDFRQAMAFVSQVAVEAEAQNHHPDIHIAYNRVRLVLSTHKVGGLSRNDFILAARINPLAEQIARIDARRQAGPR